MNERPRLLIAGCGDLGIRLAARLPHWEVHGLRRQPELLPDGIHAHGGDLSRPESLGDLAGHWDAVVYTATPSARSAQDYRRAYVEGLAGLLQVVQADRLVFVSSTAVYGQNRGEWVDEDSLAEPCSFNGEILLEAEALAASAGGIRLRFSGIYGPGRDWLIRSLRSGPLRCRREPPSWTNRIHSEDCAGVLAHLLGLAKPEHLYLASDTRPAPRWEVLSWLAEVLGVPGPIEDDASTEGQGKRIRAARLLASGYALRYPDYITGYQEMLACE
jgi:nucleoside-diphosphate-sugar epimerase